MLIPRIQQDLFAFTESDPDDFAGLAEFWYRANGVALSAALTAHRGLNFILDVKSFSGFEVLAKRLFLAADTLILRDMREWGPEAGGHCEMLVPTGPYRPGFVEDAVEQLRHLRPPTLALLNRPDFCWTSTSKTLNSGIHAAYAFAAYHPIPADALAWIAGPGRHYLETGQVVYAPFIPPLPMELEFLKHGVDLPHQFGAASLFHQRHDWMSDAQVQALLSISIPFLDGVDIQTLSEVKKDHADAFGSFSRSLMDSMNGIKSALGTEGFSREVRNIQRNLVDAALSDVERTVQRIKQSQTLRRRGILTGFVGLNAAAFVGAPAATLVTGLAAGAAALVAERVAYLRERSELADKKGYFLWQLKSASSSDSDAA